MNRKNLLNLSGLGLLILGLVLFSISRNQKNKENELLSLDNEISQDVSLTSSAVEKTNKPNLKDLIKKNLEAQEKSVVINESNKPIILKKRNYTEIEIKNMSLEEFKDLLSTTEANLPTIADIRKLPPGALHHVPQPVIQAGRDLGLLKEILAEHPDYTGEANTLYENCSEKDELPQSVRALCLTNLIQNKKASGEKLNLSIYPKEIVELSKLVIDI